MDVVKEWFEEAQADSGTYKDYNKKYTLYKGFKIEVKEGKYIILDMRFTDMYSQVTQKDREIFEEFGFIRGADLIAYQRDLKRDEYYNRRTEKFYTVKDNLEKDDPKYDSKLFNCKENIGKSIDLMFYYRTKINQFNNKYNDKDEKVEKQARVIESLQKGEQGTKSSSSK